LRGFGLSWGYAVEGHGPNSGLSCFCCPRPPSRSRRGGRRGS